MTNSEEPPPPALVNVTVKTQQDALRILQAVLAGDLEECPRRMGEHGPRVICPGDVFVFMEGGQAGITRWTDGLKDKSGSRRRGPAGAHTTCYIIYEPPARLGISPDVEWVRKVWKIRCQINGNDTVWSIVAYDFEGRGDHSLRTVQDALSSLVLPVPPPPLPPPPPPPPPPAPAPAPAPPPPISLPAIAPIQPAMLNMDGIQNAQGESPHAHLQNVEDHSELPSSQAPSPVVEFRRPLFTQSAASTSSAPSVAQAASPRRETLPSMASLQLPRPRVIPFVECAPHATQAAERTPEDARFLDLFR